MADRRLGADNLGRVPEPAETELVFRREDWYADEFTGRRFERCEFHEVDLTEAVTRGVSFIDCVFGNVRFNASQHVDTAFTGCTFARCNLFDAEFSGCKLVGSRFTECSLRPMRVLGGDWSFTGLAGADLRGVKFQGVRMREADLSRADCTGATFADVDLSGAELLDVKLGGAELRGSDLSALDPVHAELGGAIVSPEQATVLVTSLGMHVRG